MNQDEFGYAEERIRLQKRIKSKGNFSRWQSSHHEMGMETEMDSSHSVRNSSHTQTLNFRVRALGASFL